MIILDEPYAQIEIIEGKNLAIVTWKGKCTSEEYQKAFNVILEVQIKEGLTRYISDTTNQSIISPADRKWFETVALPKAIEQGLIIVGIIFDGNVFKKYYLNIIIGATNKFKLPLKLVSTKEEAINWVMTK